MHTRFIGLFLLALISGLSTSACSAWSSRSGAGAGPTDLRVVSYNIKHGVGMDGVLHLDRTAKVLLELDADVILLQEVDEVCGRSGGVDQAKALGEALEMDSAFAPFMDFDGGRYGLATLSRHPIESQAVIVLPPGKQEPRAALSVVLRVGETQVRVVNAHFDWLSDDAERFQQATVLSDAIAGMDTFIPTVFGGDLNDHPKSRAVTAFERETLPARARFRRIGPFGYTFPSDEPSKAIDHFLVAPADRWSRTEVQVVQEPLASDHRPITANLALQ